MMRIGNIGSILINPWQLRNTDSRNQQPSTLRLVPIALTVGSYCNKKRIIAVLVIYLVGLWVYC